MGEFWRHALQDTEAEGGGAHSFVQRFGVLTKISFCFVPGKTVTA